MSGLDAIGLQVIGGALRGVAEEMLAALVRSASSPNITERRDASSAVFDPSGTMIAQASAIPVHLGALPDAVSAVLGAGIAAEETWILNDPFAGGTHLPDITLVTLVAGAVGSLAIVATRAHHADVGGMRPGSMPADSRELLQEGLVIPPTRLAIGDEVDAGIVGIILANSRTPAERRGDLGAQLAAHRLAAKTLRELAERVGEVQVAAAGAAFIEYGERRVRAAIAALPDGIARARDVLEGDGTTDAEIEIAVTITVAGDQLTVDFGGCSAQVAGNLNCPIAVTRSAVLFAVQVALDPDLPASGGTLRAVTVIAPEGSVVNALPGAAVVGGNVETSSRLVDVLLQAFGQLTPMPACGQGTMNNLTIGGVGPAGPFTYYETIGGGQGGGPDGPGPSGVHVAMSNTMNTPIEMLEMAYPIRVQAYRLRPRSGGDGAAPGGLGVERRLTVLVPAEASIITERRRHGPPGSSGGAPGRPGRNLLNGVELPAKWSGRLAAGDEIAIFTPGGGGYGEADV